MRLLAPLAHDLKGLAPGGRASRARRPRVLSGRRSAWTAKDWANWRKRNWRRACEAADLDPVPRPYDLRHGFVSLLLAEGRSVHHVAGQAGHSRTMTLTRYGHVIAEHDGRERIDAEAEIRRAREGCAQNVRRTGTDG